MRKSIRLILPVFLLLICTSTFAQSERDAVAEKVVNEKAVHESLSPIPIFTLNANQEQQRFMISDIVTDAVFYDILGTTARQVIDQKPESLNLLLPQSDGSSLELWLYRAEIFTEDAKIHASSNPGVQLDFERGAYYWGIVKGNENSMAAIAMSNDEIMGFVQDGNVRYTLGKMENSDLTVFYRNSDLQVAPGLGCDTDDDIHRIGSGLIERVNEDPGTAASPANCVNLYVEVDNSIVTGKGGVTPAANYVNGAFSQVFILYANESINMTINELYLWDTVDPYTGPSTSDYLSQFRVNVGSSFNGDLAHLVGYQGGGGIAYVDVLCNRNYGHGYSDINSTYNNVPTYSWTVEVLTHEIGHNLGSRHTHACVWGPNNDSPLDCCGYNAGYSESSCGTGYNCSLPNPPKGTIMSYCHLLSGVGIDLNLGFGQEPGDLIRNRVYNSSCLSVCVDCSNNGGDNDGDGYCADVDCNDNNPNINPGSQEICDGIDNNCSGGADEGLPLNTYYVDNDGDGYGVDGGSIQICDASAPNGYANNNNDCNDSDANAYPGAPCSDGDDCTTNDALDANCNCSGIAVGDSDGDGVCDALDVCPGGDDNVDNNGNGTPDFCDCFPETGAFASNPLTHNGSGSSSTTFNFPADSKFPVFTISDLNARTNGKPANRYIDRVTVSYVDGNGSSQSYGTFNGNSVPSVNVDINDYVQSVTVSLNDGYDGNSPTLLSVSFSSIDYCGENPACPDADQDGVCDVDDVCPGFDDGLLGTACNDGNDCTTGDIYTGCNTCAGTATGDSDGDGVCDAQDICPGGDDNIDSDGDGIPDFCDNSNCNEVTNGFSPNPLTHSGNGSSSSLVSLGGNTDVSFSISNINAKTNGKGSRRYIEEVTVSYIDGGGNSQTYGVYRGDQFGSVNVSIAGAVQSVSISLADVYDGSTESSMSIDMSAVTSCASGSPAPADGSFSKDLLDAMDIQVYPNPSDGEVFMRFDNAPEKAAVQVFDMLGKQIHSAVFSGNGTHQLDLRASGLNNQFVIIHVSADGFEPVVERVLIINK